MADKLDWSNPFKGGMAGGLGNTLVGIAPQIGNLAGSALSNGYSSTAGSVVSGLGSVASAIPGPWGAVASGALGILSGGVNALFGTKVDQEALNRANAGTDYLKSFQSNASSFDEVQGPLAQHSVEDVYKGGVFNKSTARDKNADLRRVRSVAELAAQRSVDNNVQNLASTQMNALQQQWHAFGGDLLTNGAAWDTGFTYVGNGGSHESNPHEGVQMGIDPQGVPNLVEEGEVVWNDYVFSKRLKVPQAFRNKYKLKDGDSISFADAAKKFAEESEERPNDPISKKGRDTMLSTLMDTQEEVRMKKQQREARNQFNALSPEEQMGIMQMAQQNAMPAGPEEGMNMMSSYPQQAVPAQGVMPTEQFAEGGIMGNRFAGPGKRTQRLLKRYNQDWFTERARQLGMIDLDNEEQATKDFLKKFQYSTNYKDSAAVNLGNFNRLYADYQKQKAEDAYIAGQKQDWINQELASGRYKKGDDGNAIYKAQFYGDDAVGKDWISSTGERISAEKYSKLQEEANKLKVKEKRTSEEQTKLDTFNKAAYRNRPVVKGQFAKDYDGNIIYDYNNDVSSSWTPDSSTLAKNFKWDPKDAAKISYDPNINSSWQSNFRYAPVFGAGLGIITDALGLTNRPDYSNAERIEAASSVTPTALRPYFIGDYMPYVPLDRNYFLNQVRSSAAGNRRAITNLAGGNRGTAMAGIIASDNNLIGSMGKLAREATESDFADLLKTKDFNRGSNQFNATAAMNTDKANQAAWMDANRLRLTGITSGAQTRASELALANTGRTANITNFINSLGQVGEEAYDNDRLNALIERGVLQDLYGKHANGGMLTKPNRKKGGRK